MLLRRFVVVVAVLVGVAGCSGAGRAAASVDALRLPPRPVELRLDGVEPCALLTPAQVVRLGVRAGERRDSTDELGTSACRWPTDGSSYVARLIVRRGADYALGSTTGAEVVSLDGFSAVQTSSPYVDAKNHCVLVIDVARGESLGVQWLAFGPGSSSTHAAACERTREAARLMLTTLRGLVG